MNKKEKYCGEFDFASSICDSMQISAIFLKAMKIVFLHFSFG